MPSLLDGRNAAPLTEHQQRAVVAVFYGLDPECPVRYEDGQRTVFRSGTDATGQPFAEVLFGPDIYPGNNIVDANSVLDMKAAAAHEICHYRRHVDMRELNEPQLAEIDEALTSLEAARRFPRDLTSQDVEHLIGDAIQRLRRFVDKYRAGEIAP